MKDYCTQNNGNCETCSLVNYGKDCYNNPVNQIAYLRTIKNLTQQQLAEKIGCLQKDISRWETGVYKPSIDNYKKIADALNCKVDDLI